MACLKWTSVAVFVLYCVPAMAAQIIDSNERLDFPRPDDSPNAMVEVNGAIYIGGGFTWFAERVPHFSVTDATTGEADFAWEGGDGGVQQIIADGSGGYYICGGFEKAGGQPHARVAHILASKAIDHAFDAQVNDLVNAIALSGSMLYIGGQFSEVNGETIRNVAALDAATGALISSFEPDPSHQVYDLAVDGNYLYVAGVFSTLSGGAVNIANLARVDKTSGVADTSWVPAPQSWPHCMAFSGTTLYMGGSFTTVNAGTVARNGLAAVSTVDGTALPWNPNPNYANVEGISIDGAYVWVAGGFTLMGGQSRQRVAKVSAAGAGAIEAWTPAANTGNGLYCMALSGNVVYVGGLPWDAGGVVRNGCFALDKTTGALLPWNPDSGGPAVRSIVADANGIAIGGDFDVLNTVPRAGLAAIDIATGDLLPWAPQCDVDANGSIKTMLFDGTYFYVGGDFEEINGEPRRSLAALDINGDLVADWNPWIGDGGWGEGVYGMTLLNDTLYVVGNFVNVGDGTVNAVRGRNHAAAVDAVGVGAGTGAATAWDPNVGGGWDQAYAIATDGNVIYISGTFLTAGGTSGNPTVNRSALASFEPGGTGAARAWNPNLVYNPMYPDSTQVYALTVANNMIYAVGIFATVGGLDGNPLTNRWAAAAFELDDGVSKGAATAWDPAPADEALHCIAVAGDRAYIGGRFFWAGGGSTVNPSVQRERFAVFDAVGTGYALDWVPWYPYQPYSLLATDNGVFAGGDGFLFFPAMAGITNVTLPGAFEGQSYTAQLEADGIGPFVWSIPAAQLPTGMSINASTGVISGIPAAGTGNRMYELEVSVEDQGNLNPSPWGESAKTFQLFVGGAAGTLPYLSSFESGQTIPAGLTAGANARALIGDLAGSAGGGDLGIKLDAIPGGVNWALQPVPGQAGANDPSQWDTLAPDHVGKLEWMIDASASGQLAIEFGYKITNDANPTTSAWYTNFVFEWSDDGGASWTIASDANAVAGGIYRTDTAGAFVDASIGITGFVPVNDLRLRWRWLVKWSNEDAIPTWIAIDNVSVTSGGPAVAPGAPTQLFIGSTGAQTGASGNPVIDIDGTPVFSAIFTDPTLGDTAVAYRVQVAADTAFATLLWDSGVTGTAMTAVANGARCADIAYAGAVLSPGATYVWRIKFWDSGINEGVWSSGADSFTLAGVPLEILTASLPSAIYTIHLAPTSYGPVVLEARGGTAPYTWTATGLPAGIELTGDTIAGTLTAVGEFDVIVTVTDSGLPQALETVTLRLSITSPAPSRRDNTASSGGLCALDAHGGAPWPVLVGLFGVLAAAMRVRRRTG